jgi:DNA-binding XRE family transcriptional regulator/quercetin dioxygenase-like cupin family protein
VSTNRLQSAARRVKVRRPAPQPLDAPAQSKAGKVSENLGARLRQGRAKSGITLRELARRIGVSASLVSQIERGRVMPSVGTLFAITNLLGLVIDDLFKGDGNGRSAHAAQAGSGPVQMRHNRKAIQMAAGVRWERLTAEPDPDVEFLYVVYDAGAASCQEDALFQHRGKEYAYLLSGRLGVRIGFEEYELGPGDAISFDAQLPHRLWCIGREPAIGIWTIIRRRGDSRQPIEHA